MSRPTIFQIKEAIIKNVCAPDAEELEDLATSKIIRTSTKREGDAELGIILLIGISAMFGYPYHEISMLTSVEYDEYEFKLKKFRARLKGDRNRFWNKVKLILNYLRLKYGVVAILPTRKK